MFALDFILPQSESADLYCSSIEWGWYGEQRILHQAAVLRVRLNVEGVDFSAKRPR